MNPTVTSILQRGFFPKELPPPFNTFSFGTKYDIICNNWRPILSDPASTLVQSPIETLADFNKRKKAFKEEFKKIYTSSVCLEYSISKGKLSRRYIGIPNPLNYMYQTEKIVEGWDDILQIINASKYSHSKPIFQNELNKRTFKTSSKGVAEFLKHILEASYDKTVELKLDLSKFYPTISVQTHEKTF